ncbi:hypothetical protein [Hydrogenothermus marinus]|uniref:Uncharacterized protein n=1 Tax=Hydrogenothermus marinus TaxID=133270 RepID=A0A3M0BF72_9AQUI|nr:hypothetical protein [Hydrogenothermus marinus]RMA93245.1 hypothetical protein CLV39_1306 [Hydrogenothermus marinus]
MKVKVGQTVPYFEFLDGIEGKSSYDLRNRWHIIIYKSSKLDLSDKEEELEKAGIKLIDYIQILTKDLLDKIDIKNKDEFLILIDRYGVINYMAEGENLPNFENIMETIQFIEDEGCCSL